jgi:hypothetical protein
MSMNAYYDYVVALIIMFEKEVHRDGGDYKSQADDRWGAHLNAAARLGITDRDMPVGCDCPREYIQWEESAAYGRFIKKLAGRAKQKMDNFTARKKTKHFLRTAQLFELAQEEMERCLP